MAVVAGVLLDHVEEDPAQAHGFAPAYARRRRASRPRPRWPGPDRTRRPSGAGRARVRARPGCRRCTRRAGRGPSRAPRRGTRECRCARSRAAAGRGSSCSLRSRRGGRAGAPIACAETRRSGRRRARRARDAEAARPREAPPRPRRTRRRRPRRARRCSTSTSRAPSSARSASSQLDVQVADGQAGRCGRRSPAHGAGDRDGRASQRRSRSRPAGVIGPGADDGHLGAEARERTGEHLAADGRRVLDRRRLIGVGRERLDADGVPDQRRPGGRGTSTATPSEGRPPSRARRRRPRHGRR